MCIYMYIYIYIYIPAPRSAGMQRVILLSSLLTRRGETSQGAARSPKSLHLSKVDTKLDVSTLHGVQGS